MSGPAAILATDAAGGGRLTAFVEAHTRAWEAGCGVMALGFLATAFANDQNPSRLTTVLVATFTVLFLAEFSARCWDAPSRWHYARAHWLDVVSCVPVVGGLRAVRLLRVAKVLLVARAMRGVSAHVVDRGSVAFLGPILVLLWLGASVAAWVLEHGVNPALRTFGDALYWSFVTATTVGYGDIAPVTAEGRVLAGLLAFLGIGLLGFASARLTARLLQQQDEADPTARIDAEEVRALRREIAELRALLEASRNEQGLPC